MQKGKVSVYITNYNYAKYIENAIESVLNQTYKKIEILIIDDGSTDNSRDIIEKYRSVSNIKIIYQLNRGLNVTNNIALHASDGEFIMRLDADDWLDQFAIEILVYNLAKDPDVGLVFPDYYIVDSFGEVLELVRRHDFSEVTLHNSPAHGACTMIRTSFLRNIGGYDESFRCQDGLDLWLNFVGNYKVQNVNLPLFYYRQHGSNLTTNKSQILDTRAKIIRSSIEKKSIKRSKVVAIVPIRGNSVDINSKPLNFLGPKRLIQWTIDSLLECSQIIKIYIATSDSEVISFVEEYYNISKIELVIRPENLSYLNVPISETIKLIHNNILQTNSDGIFQVTIENPFRTAQTFTSMIDLLDLFNTDIVVPVIPESAIFYCHDGHSLKPILPHRDSKLKLEREDVFREEGSMRLFRINELNFIDFDGTIGHMILDHLSSIKVNSNFDWNVAELIALGKLK